MGQKWFYKNFVTAFTTNTRLRMVFFSVETWVFVDVNQLIPWFSQGFLTCSDREGSLIAEWRAKTYQNTAFLILFISSRWRITLLKQWGLCELSEIAEIISIVIKRNGFQVVYLFDCMKSREPWIAKEHKFREQKMSHRQGTKVSCERRLFSKMNFVTCRSTYHFSCYDRIES